MAVVLILFGVPGYAAPLEDVFRRVLSGQALSKHVLTMIPGVVTTIIPCFMAWILWENAGTFSTCLMPERGVDREGDPSEGPIMKLPSSTKLLFVTISTVGLVTVVYAIIQVVTALISEPWSLYQPIRPFHTRSGTMGYVSAVAWLLIGGIGLGLLFRARDVLILFQPSEQPSHAD